MMHWYIMSICRLSAASWSYIILYAYDKRAVYGIYDVLLVCECMWLVLYTGIYNL